MYLLYSKNDLWLSKYFVLILGFVSAVVLNYMTELRIQRAQSRKGLKKFVEEIHKSTQKMPGE